jgi:Tfp pilus assembly protein PilP
MKLTTGIVVLAMTTGTVWAQKPAVVQSTRTALQGVQQQRTAASNAALQAKPSGAVAARPAPMPAVAPTKTQVTFKAQPVAKKPARAEHKHAAGGAVLAQPATQQASAPSGTSSDASDAPRGEVQASTTSGEDAAKPDKQEDKKYSMNGKRDPFVSPVVNRGGGSGCSTGKKCLDIEQIALHGVVKSDNGMIAVVTNSLNKAYFLRENDPVFNGYVVKITVDSIVFKETFQDRLGKPFTKDVVKRILTPAV